MKKENIIKRTTVDERYIFYSPDRSFKSKYFKTKEEREQAIEAYVDKENKSQKELEDRIKKEKELINE